MSERLIRLILVTLGILGLVEALRADTITEPPSKVRQWVITTSTTAGSVSFTDTTGIGDRTIDRFACAVRVIHDTASGPDIYVSLKKSQSDVAAPTNGGEVFTLKAGESFLFEGKWWQLRHLAASGTPTLRVIVTFNQ